MNKSLKVGDHTPQFKVKDQDGKLWESKDLQGNVFILYFYPKDDTPGCTKEACSFRDHLPDFSETNIQILGVSPDDAVSHQKFIKKHNLNFNLLTDEDKSLCNIFGVLDGKGVVRSTFLIDAQGIIRWIEKPVTIEGHVERVKEAIENL